MKSISANLNLMIKASEKASKVLIRDFGEIENLQVSRKGPRDFVTNSDIKVEKIIFEELKKARPNYSFISEEKGYENNKDTSNTWVIDPIDGTRSFISGTPTWGVLISLEQIGFGPIFGIIDQPYINERFIGGFGTSEVRGPLGVRPLKTATTQSLSESKLFTTFPEVGTETDKMGFAAVAREVKLVRYGLDCYAYALVAAGQVDLVIEASLNAYDIQAPIGVIEAAGGIVTSWSGKPAYLGGQVLAAANQRLHKQALNILNSYSDD